MSETAIVSAETKSSWIAPSWCSWTKYSESMLCSIEKRILSILKTAYRGWYVDIGPVVGPADKIWTISLNSESKNTPLVLLHGLGAGVALWCLNLDAFAATRPVYAIDVLGFGRSSRPGFSNDAMEAEKQLVRSVEEWRREMKLEKFVLLGHSLGGFLATSYALTYPEKVKHLILADPWGFPEKPPETEKKAFPLWVKALAYTLAPFNPFAAVRVAGPWGQWVLEKTRPDIARKFSGILEDESLITQYIYQCNSQTPSGESAFHCMMSRFGWAKNPMIKRIGLLDENVPITLIQGAKSWLEESLAIGPIIKEKRSNSYVQLQIIPDAGHHVYADKFEIFNERVVEACSNADGIPTKHLTVTSSNSEDTESYIEADDDKREASPITPDT